MLHIQACTLTLKIRGAGYWGIFAHEREDEARSVGLDLLAGMLYGT